MSGGLAEITKIHVGEVHIAESMAALKQAGKNGCEGIALWAGIKESGAVFRVTEAVVPNQIAIRSPSGVAVMVNSEELHRLNVWLFRNCRLLIAQIHSHPGEAYHSETDDEFAIAASVGSLSLVVPYFARGPFTLETCAAYRLSADGAWEHLPVSQLQRLIVVER